MNPKFSGCALALIGMAAMNACGPIDNSYSRNNRAGDRRANPAATAAGPSMNGNRQAQQSSQLAQRSMAELESEELSIRNSTSLSPTEKQLQLHRVWKEQRDLANLRTASPSDAPAPSHQEQPDRSSAAASAPDPAQSTTQKTSIPEETKKSQPPTGPVISAPNPAPAPKTDEPKYATKVPGKNGWIKSPYDGKILDAAGIPPGTQVKDPDSGKIMLVP